MPVVEVWHIVMVAGDDDVVVWDMHTVVAVVAVLRGSVDSLGPEEGRLGCAHDGTLWIFFRADRY